jgi:hypothetical protein
VKSQKVKEADTFAFLLFPPNCLADKADFSAADLAGSITPQPYS